MAIKEASQEEFIAGLRDAGLEPYHSKDGIMISTENKRDLRKMKQVAKELKFFGSYGWEYPKKKDERREE